MSIDDAIRHLQQERKTGIKHVVMAYWCPEMFGMEEGPEWAAAAEIGDDIDWSNTHDQIKSKIDEEGDK
jgi:hypothetical protein